MPLLLLGFQTGLPALLSVESKCQRTLNESIRVICFFHLLRLRCSLSMLLHNKAFIANAKIPHKHRQIQIFQPLDIAPPLFSSFENSRKILYLQALPPPFSAIQQSEIGICFQGFHHAAHQTTVSLKNIKPLSRTLHTTPATSPHSAPLQNITQTK